jgi:hypothetical protein
LPVNCQSVLILPASKISENESEVAVVFGSNQAKVFKFKDINRLKELVRLFEKS